MRDPLDRASPAVGVGQCITEFARLDPPFVCWTNAPRPSRAVGVGQFFARSARLSDPCAFCPFVGPRESRASGVGQAFAHIPRLGVPRVGRSCGTLPSFWLEPYSVALGVGYSPRDHEEPVAAVRGTNGACRYAVPDRIVPERGQVSENDSEPPSKES
jgi:hypothetical protein